MPGPFAFYGGNADAFNSKEPEVLLAGAAGTGKSLAWLAKILTLCDRYPGARCLIVRKTRESLTESILVTWERDILGHGHRILRRNPTLRRVRQSYRIGNGSEVVVGGLDKPDKILSSEWDLIYCAELTDLTLTDFETLGGRLRAGIVPFQQLCGDCNPTNPSHWAYKRQAAGLMRMYTSTHKDNPRFFNRHTKRWTPDGEKYLERLGRMTGARKARFLDGKWVSAEGAVYDYRAAPEYDDNGVMTHPGHLLPAIWMPPPHWTRVWGIDWGKTSPTVLGLWAVDPDGRMHLYREVYQTRLRADELGKWAIRQIREGREPRPRAIVCDHDEERKGLFEKASTPDDGTDGLRLELADKKDRDKGIEQTQARFDLDDDGRPRIFFRADCRETLRGHEADRFLVDEGRPTSGLEEIVGYTWDPDFLEDTPIEDNDHSMDQMRYVARWVDTYHTASTQDFYGSISHQSPGAVHEELPAGTFG